MSFQLFYTAEMIFKIIALGFIYPNHAYLRSYWNLMDFIVVIIGWITIMTGGGHMGMSAFRSIRALRTLRMVSARPSLSKLVGNLFKILPLMGNITLLCFVIVIVFAVISM